MPDGEVGAGVARQRLTEEEWKEYERLIARHKVLFLVALDDSETPEQDE